MRRAFNPRRSLPARGARVDNATMMRPHTLPIAAVSLAALLSALVLAEQPAGVQQGVVKSETFDRDPGWDRSNNRPADRKDEPVEVRQDFGFSNTSHAGGKRGEAGGRIQAAAEAAFYGKVIGEKTLQGPLSASGTLAVARRRDAPAPGVLQRRHGERVAHAEHRLDPDQRPGRPLLRVRRVLHVQVARRRRQPAVVPVQGGPGDEAQDAARLCQRDEAAPLVARVRPGRQQRRRARSRPRSTTRRPSATSTPGTRPTARRSTASACSTS